MTAAYQQPTTADIADALGWISPDCEREYWVRILMAVKAALGDAGRDIAEAMGTRLGNTLFLAFWTAVIAVPLAALFREGGNWAAYVERNGKAALRRLELGRRNAAFAEVTSGLAAGERVILHPSDQLADGAAVVAEIQD